MGLKVYIARRVFQSLVTLWAFITLLFFAFRLMPGDPTSVFAPAGLSPEIRQEIIARHGLNEPLHIQYIKYIGNLLQGDLGHSFFYNTPVSNIIVEKFFNTIFLMAGGFTLAILIGTAFGGFLAWRRGSKVEKYGSILPFVIRSMPSFWIGILLIMLFAVTLDLFPVGGFGSVGGTYEGLWSRYLRTEFLYYVTLPMLTVAIYYSAVPTLVMRNTMLDIMNTDFIDIKEAEGIGEYAVVLKHIMRNSLLPIITVTAIVAGQSVGGAVLIEVVFNWPGMGRAMVDAVYGNDYPLAMAAFFLMGVSIIVMNLVADILYAYLDPRVTYGD